jgi:hypothetical protein
LKENPELTFDEAFERFLRPHEGRVHMNQVPPKVFEAAALRTALVMFEGHYSGVVQPDEHFIPLKKDFSNAEEVIEKVRDISYLEAMTERTHRDIVRSGQFSYAVLGMKVAEAIDRLAPPARPRRFAYAVVTCARDRENWSLPIHNFPYTQPVVVQALPKPPKPPVPPLPSRLRMCWLLLPKAVRWPLKKTFKPIVNGVVVALRRLATGRKSD